MLKADADSATSEATAHPVESLNDFNPDTYWNKSSEATQYIIFDKNDTTTSVDALVLFIHNYKSNFAFTNPLLVMDDNAGFSSPTTKLGNLSLTDTATPIRIYDFASSGSERYWKIKLPNLAMHIALVLLCKKWTVDQGREFPLMDTDEYYNQVLKAPGGREHVIMHNQNPGGTFTDTFQISGTTSFNAFRNAFDDAKANGLPVIRQPGATNSTADLVRFVSGKFARVEQDHELYRPTIVSRLMPYVDDGETY